MENKKIIMTGDIHGQFGELNTLINRKNPEMVICAGDFGYWPITYDYVNYFKKIHPFDQIKPKQTQVLWIDGNHENFWELAKRRSDEEFKGVRYMPRGSTYTLPDGRVVLFMGGGLSVDKNYRKFGVDWFPEEQISEKDVRNLPDIDIDIIVSHTCPFVLRAELCGDNRFKDASEDALQYMLHKYKPSLWVFGHWHTYKAGIIKETNTRWYALSMCGYNHGPSDSNWWIYLPI